MMFPNPLLFDPNQYRTVVKRHNIVSTTLTELLKGNSARVGLWVAFGDYEEWQLSPAGVLVGPPLGTDLIPIISLTSATPCCFVSAAMIGAAIGETFIARALKDATVIATVEIIKK